MRGPFHSPERANLGGETKKKNPEGAYSGKRERNRANCRIEETSGTKTTVSEDRKSLWENHTGRHIIKIEGEKKRVPKALGEMQE